MAYRHCVRSSNVALSHIARRGMNAAQGLTFFATADVFFGFHSFDTCSCSQCPSGENSLVVVEDPKRYQKQNHRDRAVGAEL